VFFTFGPHENPSRLVAGITSALLRGSAAPCSEGTQARDFLHVSDIGDAFAALLASDVAGAVNIASGEAISVRDLVEMIAARTGGRELLRFGAVPLSPNEPPLIVADVSRLRDELKWAPRVSLIERIDGTIEWWRAVLNAGSAGVVTGDQLPPARMRVSP
jgi:nucleoside-diphosphate-sugar epimerase